MNCNKRISSKKRNGQHVKNMEVRQEETLRWELGLHPKRNLRSNFSYGYYDN